MSTASGYVDSVVFLGGIKMESVWRSGGQGRWGLELSVIGRFLLCWIVCLFFGFAFWGLGIKGAWGIGFGL